MATLATHYELEIFTFDKHFEFISGVLFFKETKLLEKRVKLNKPNKPNKPNKVMRKLISDSGWDFLGTEEYELAVGELSYEKFYSQ